MEFISRHIMRLVIDSLGGGHTHTNTHTHTNDPHMISFKKPGARCGQRAWFKNLYDKNIHIQMMLVLVYSRAIQIDSFKPIMEATNDVTTSVREQNLV